MGPKIDPAVERSVKLLSSGGQSVLSIKKELEKSGTSISRATIYRIINNSGKRRRATAAGHPVPPNTSTLKKGQRSS